MSLEMKIQTIARAARKASFELAQASEDARNGALAAMAAALRDGADAIVAANELDMAAAREAGTSESILDRLMLDAARIESMACALEELIALPDPVGRELLRSTMYNGIDLTRVSVPLGVVAVVYEARPNVTADAAGICLKSGNACILRGGSLAAHSNEAISRALADAVEGVGLPRECVSAITVTDRAATDALLKMRGLVDVLIPRGGAGLINHCVEHAQVPIIETGTGNCHVYVHETADFSMARDIVLNAKCRRFGVCNAAETLLVDESVARDFLPGVMRALAEKGVTLHCDSASFAVAVALEEEAGIDVRAVQATSEDWPTEYLGPELAICCVSGYDDAISHINIFGTHHSEAIVADPSSERGAEAIERFVNRVDAAAVYVNASTAFTDGGQFGLGAEIGISTQKLHARGPFALEALTSYKYVLRGNGQVRA